MYLHTLIMIFSATGDTRHTNRENKGAIKSLKASSTVGSKRFFEIVIRWLQTFFELYNFLDNVFHGLLWTLITRINICIIVYLRILTSSEIKDFQKNDAQPMWKFVGQEIVSYFFLDTKGKTFFDMGKRQNSIHLNREYRNILHFCVHLF